MSNPRSRPTPDVFVNLRDAVIRSSRNYHRLEQLGRSTTTGRPSFTLHEETITDLIIGEMAGRVYDVAAACPTCADDTALTVEPDTRTCPEWEGVPAGESVLRIRPLTKAQEGGNRKQSGVHSDFILMFENSAVTDDEDQVSQVRLMVQAKRITPTTKFLTGQRERTQYDCLIAAATALDAVPYYALYVQQDDAHSSTRTACTTLAKAADVAIVLVAAHADTARRLPGKQGVEVIAQGRPFPCLAGCRCSGTSRGSRDTWETSLAFIQRDFPTYQPSTRRPELPSGLPRVTVDDARVRPCPAPREPRHRSVQSPRSSSSVELTPGDILVVRLGKQRPSNDDREWIGWGPNMTPKQIMEATRRYWRLDLERASRMRFAVATSSTAVVGVYSIVPDSLEATGPRGLRRVEMQLADVVDSDLRKGLADQAVQAVARLPRGARTPFTYA
ncbi:hypothetical protein OG218_26480 [Kineococcus sp. NBC_00420]|uniref:hypothetical protein n=1 Tax=Kineococcus sp. NBC_00420 TaxID=2903564 RepID=UPI002E24636B